MVLIFLASLEREEARGRMNRLRFFKKQPVDLRTGGFDDGGDLSQEEEEMDLRDMIIHSRHKAFYKSYDDMRQKSHEPNPLDMKTEILAQKLPSNPLSFIPVKNQVRHQFACSCLSPCTQQPSLPVTCCLGVF